MSAPTKPPDTETVASLTAELADVDRRITGLREEADRGEMFQDVSPQWHGRYLAAVRELAKARTYRERLAQRLADAKRAEEARAEAQRLAERMQQRRAELEREIAEAGVLG
ncbi:hypothetical protein B7C42_01598 [Nocardia cerradoensis]|uniref:Uncharacterized protein n=1 Tax=Nocardia cerradoensis TaxID=85688 RepID=A0A231HCF2_9NOCA|nr:hypothetical protein [Nocardia cerradoensis]OXR46624.1 hypothetical protein B7C42_01598 [Nocardia cerradoensis]